MSIGLNLPPHGGRRLDLRRHTRRVADIVLPRADTVIWIEQPALLCVLRAYGRTLRHLGRTRPDMARGCPERLSPRLWRYATRFNSAMRPRIEAWLSSYAPTTPVIRLNGDRAVAMFLRVYRR